MQVKVSSTAEEFIRNEMTHGRYESAAEMIDEGLLLLRERNLVEAQRRARINDEIEIGLQELDRGEGISGKSVFRELRERSRRRRAS